jgi:hypothetical protein
MTTKKREALAQSSVVSALKDMPCRLCSVLARRLQALLMPAHSPLRSAPSPTLCAQSHSAYTECSRSFPSCSQLHRSTLSCCTTTAAWHRPTQGRCTRRCIITCFQGPPRGGAQICPRRIYASLFPPTVTTVAHDVSNVLSQNKLFSLSNCFEQASSHTLTEGLPL